MLHEFDELKRVFRGILVALAVPAAGCGGATPLATNTGATDASVDAASRADVVDVPPPPPDDGRCTPVPTTGTCNESVLYPCGVPELPPGAQSVTLTTSQCDRLCAPAFTMGRNGGTGCSAGRSAQGAESVVVNCATCAIGRRTQGFTAREGATGDAIGRYFAAAAQLEAASVVAFRTLADELRAHGAPSHLIDHATRSAAEERRHARITRHIAQAHGSDAPPVSLTPRAPRTLAEVALENAVEGCVRETFGALVAHWQRERAEDVSVREAMAVIAEDETRHAALAWSVHAWLAPRLDDATREAVRVARACAVDALARELAAEVPDALVRGAGLPPREVATAMLEGLRAARWARA